MANPSMQQNTGSATAVNTKTESLIDRWARELDQLFPALFIASRSIIIDDAELGERVPPDFVAEDNKGWK